MMAIPPSDARNLSLWEYEALLYHWNEAHDGVKDHDPPPDRDKMERLIDRINADPALHGPRRKPVPA